MCVNQGLALTQDAEKAPEKVHPGHGRLALTLISCVACDIWAPSPSFLVCKRDALTGWQWSLDGRKAWAEAVQPVHADSRRDYYPRMTHQGKGRSRPMARGYKSTPRQAV